MWQARVLTLQVDSGVDYRRLAPSSTTLRRNGGGHFFVGDDAQERWSEAWASAAGGVSEQVQLPVAFGRTVSCVLAEQGSKGGAEKGPASVAMFAFAELCCSGRNDASLGAADYLALSNRVGTLFVEGVPRLSLKQRNEARRFITLIDAMYEGGCRIVASAECHPDELFSAFIDAPEEEYIGGAEISLSDGPNVEASLAMGIELAEEDRLRGAELSGEKVRQLVGAFSAREEKFMYRRAVSRLQEMLG